MSADDDLSRRGEHTFCAVTADEVLATMQGSRHGISQSDAAARLIQHGPNQLPASQAPGLLRLFLSQFLSLLIYMLRVAAVWPPVSGRIRRCRIHFRRAGGQRSGAWLPARAMYTPGLNSVPGVQPVTLDHWLDLLAMEPHKWLRFVWCARLKADEPNAPPEDDARH